MNLAAYHYDQHVLDPGPVDEEPRELCDACVTGDCKHCESPVRCDCTCGDRQEVRNG